MCPQTSTSVKQHSESIHFLFFFIKKLKKSKVAKNYVLVQGRPTHTPGGGGRLDILWCCPQISTEATFRVNPFFIFFQKEIKKIKSCKQLCTGFRAGLPTLQGAGAGLTSSGVSSDQHLSEATFRVNPFFIFFS